MRKMLRLNKMMSIFTKKEGSGIGDQGLGIGE
jgi:hypothetical protein